MPPANDALNDTVEACLAWLGSDAATMVHSPRSTMRPTVASQDVPLSGAAMDLELEASRGRFEFDDELGAGGMGVVYLASQRSLGRHVAIKTLRPTGRNDESGVNMLREAWAMGQLEHPNILPIHDLCADEDGRPQAVLKRIDGIVWEDVIDDGDAVRDRFGVSDLLEHNLEVLLHVCQAVRFAHSRGIVHRDLKPENVMIGAFGEVYVLDWGLAVALPGRPADTGRLPQAAEVSEPAGTPAYMAPEMLGRASHPISERTDIYLLGGVLYEILTGSAPHEGDDVQDMIRSIVSSSPRLPADAPPELADVVIRAMQPVPGDRYESVDELRAALLEFRRHAASRVTTRQAEIQLESLRRLCAEGSEASRVVAHDLYGACRFGFERALDEWPRNDAAREGLDRASMTMIELELAHGNPEEAWTLLERPRDPPRALIEEVKRALERKRRERARLQTLERLGERHDQHRGWALRRRIILVVGLCFCIFPIGSLIKAPEDHGLPPGLVVPTILLALLGAVLARHWRTLFATVINQYVIAVVTLALVGQLGIAAATVALGLDPLHTRALMFLLWSVLGCVAALILARRLLIVAAGYAMAFIIALAVPRLEIIIGTMIAANLVTTLVAYSIWRPEAESDSQRYRLK